MTDLGRFDCDDWLGRKETPACDHGPTFFTIIGKECTHTMSAATTSRTTRTVSFRDYRNAIDGQIEAGFTLGQVEDFINACSIDEDQKAAGQPRLPAHGCMHADVPEADVGEPGPPAIALRGRAEPR